MSKDELKLLIVENVCKHLSHLSNIISKDAIVQMCITDARMVALHYHVKISDAEIDRIVHDAQAKYEAERGV